MAEVESSEEIAASTWPDFWKLPQPALRTFYACWGRLGLIFSRRMILSFAYFPLGHLTTNHAKSVSLHEQEFVHTAYGDSRNPHDRIAACNGLPTTTSVSLLES